MYYEDEPSGSEGCLRGALIIALALVVLGGFIYFGLGRATSNLNPFDNVSLPNPLQAPPTTIAIDRPAVIRQIQSLNKLQTTTYIGDKVITAGQQGSAFYNFFQGDSLILIANGEVIAGFDLAKLRDGDVVISDDGESATVTLPPAEILVSRLDNEKTQVYDRNTGIFTGGNPGLESEARRVAEQQIVQAACDGGILARAVTDGKRNIENLVKSFGIDNVTVNSFEGPCVMPSAAPTQ